MLVQNNKIIPNPEVTFRIFRMLTLRRLIKILSIDLNKISKNTLKIHEKSQAIKKD